MIYRVIARACIAAMASLLTATFALGEDGVTADSILLGRSAGITGAQAVPMQENGAEHSCISMRSINAAESTAGELS